MSRKNIHRIAVILALLVLLFPTLVVFAKELGALAISGPGIKGEIRIDDQQALRDLEAAGIYVFQPVKDVKVTGEGYRITSYLNTESGTQPWVQFVYHPDPAGGSGYVMVEKSLIESGYPANRWFHFEKPADEALRKLLAAHGVDLSTVAAQPDQAAVKEPAIPPVKVEPAKPVMKAEPAAGASLPEIVTEEKQPAGQPALPAQAASTGRSPMWVTAGLVAILALLGAARLLSSRRAQPGPVLDRPSGD